MSQPWGDYTQAFFAIDQPKVLVLFVHGYGGDYDSTWQEFQPMMRTERNFRYSDIIYYGYRSRAGQVGEHADDLNTYIRELISARFDPLTGISKPWNGYDSIIVVAHSMGAVLIRRAMLTANIHAESWINRTRMVLFAPAHNGTGVPKTVLANVHWILRAIAAFLSTLSMPIAELDPQLSKIIEKLKEDTQSLLNKGGGEFTKAFHVIWARGDLVVSNEQFCSDPGPEKVENSSHSAVCKPHLSVYPLPFDKVHSAV